MDYGFCILLHLFLFIPFLGKESVTCTCQISNLKRAFQLLSFIDFSTMAHQIPHQSPPRVPYAYSPVNEAAREIRLLTILPDVFAAELQLEIQTHVFARETSTVQYEALSYTWGSPKEPLDVFVSQGFISVTKNLAEALQYLRYEDKPRTMWIDAICVNQQDTDERSSQVKRMADIYSAASQVVVWLGPESTDSTTAMDCCELIASSVTVDWIQQALYPVSTEIQWASDEAPLPFSHEELIAISHLLNREWFKRLWIWQEVSLASKVIVLCGTRTLSWLAIQNAVFTIHVKSLAQHSNISWSHRQLLRNLCKGPKGLSLDKLIENTKYSLCSDSRDRIFALFSLLSAYDRGLTIEPDYSKPPTQVFMEFTMHYIRGRKHLKLLSTVESREENWISGLPSWIADWSRPRLTTPFTRTKFSGLSKASVTLKGDGCLEVVGKTIGTIDMVEPFQLPDPESQASMFPRVCTELRRLCHVLDWSDLLIQDGPNLDRLCSVLCPTSVLEIISSSKSDYRYLSFQDVRTSLREALRYNGNEETLVLGTGMRIFINSVLLNCYGRSLIHCHNGTIGLAPRYAREGDRVTVWLGCDTAMVLRHDKSKNRYRLIGEAIYDGAMDGSAFLGPLPDGYQLVLTEVEEYNQEYSAWGWRFVNKKLGIVVAEDPRLEGIQLPKGWSGSRTMKGEFVNDETGEKTMYDPRFTDEILEARVFKEVFELI